MHLLSDVRATGLSENESLQFDILEKTIRKGLTVFYEVGRALKIIRDGKLFRENFDTFENYCQSRWEFERAHAYRLIAFSDLITNLSPMGDVLPTSERQARPLTKLKPDQQLEAWKEIINRAPEIPTTKLISEVVASMTVKRPLDNISSSDVLVAEIVSSTTDQRPVDDTPLYDVFDVVAESAKIRIFLRNNLKRWPGGLRNQAFDQIHEVMREFPIEDPPV